MDDAALAAATDDASLVEAAGGTVRLVEAPPENFKVTTPADLAPRRGRPVLTDYHVHLRPDEDDSPAERYFTEANADRYREAADERGIEELGVAEHIHRFVQSLDVWTHAWYRHWAADDVDEYCDFLRAAELQGRHRGRLPARPRGPAANFLDGRDWDYVVGSVHFLRDEAVDFHGYPEWEPWNIWRGADPERSGRATSRRSARRRAAACSTSSPTPTWSRSGAPRAGARGRPAPLLRARDGRGGLHRGPEKPPEIIWCRPVPQARPWGGGATFTPARRRSGYEHERALMFDAISSGFRRLRAA